MTDITETVSEIAPVKRRGRPPGAKNKPKTDEVTTDAAPKKRVSKKAAKKAGKKVGKKGARKGGRPKGSRNRLNDELIPQEKLQSFEVDIDFSDFPLAPAGGAALCADYQSDIDSLHIKMNGALAQAVDAYCKRSSKAADGRIVTRSGAGRFILEAVLGVPIYVEKTEDTQIEDESSSEEADDSQDAETDDENSEDESEDESDDDLEDDDDSEEEEDDE